MGLVYIKDSFLMKAAAWFASRKVAMSHEKHGFAQ